MSQNEQQPVNQTLIDFLEYLACINYDTAGMQPLYDAKGKMFFNDEGFQAQYEIFKFVYKIGFRAGQEHIKSKLREIAK